MRIVHQALGGTGYLVIIDEWDMVAMRPVSRDAHACGQITGGGDDLFVEHIPFAALSNLYRGVRAHRQTAQLGVLAALLAWQAGYK